MKKNITGKTGYNIVKRIKLFAVIMFGLVLSASVPTQAADITWNLLDGVNYVAEDIGEIPVGNYTVQGVAGATYSSILDLNTKTGFELIRVTNLIFNTVKVTGENDLVTVHNPSATVNINNSYIDGNIVSGVGHKGTININNAAADVTTFAGSVNADTINLNAGTLKLTQAGDISAANKFVVNGCTLDIADGTVSNKTINDITLNNDLEVALDFNIEDAVSDTLTINGVTTGGNIVLASLNLLGSETTFDNIAPDFKVQILKSVSDDVKLTLSANVQTTLGNTEYLIDHVDEYYVDDAIEAENIWVHNKYKRHTHSELNVYGKLGLATTDTEDDSIGINESRREGDVVTDSNLGDTLVLVNQADIDGREFVTTDATAEYVLSENLGVTGSGAFLIKGAKTDTNISFLNLNDKTGFELAKVSALTLDTVKVDNAKDDVVATVTNSDAVINLKDVVLNGNIVGNAAANFVTNISGLTSIDGKITNSDVNVKGGILTINTDTFEASDVTFTAGKLDLIDNNFKQYKFNAIDGRANARFSIDFDLANGGKSDTILATDSALGVVTIGEINLINPDTTLSKSFNVKILTQPDSGTATLTLNSTVQDMFLRKEYKLSDVITHERQDAVTANTSWTDVFNVYKQLENLYGRLSLTKSNPYGLFYDSIGVTVTRTVLQEEYIDHNLGDTLKLVNQANLASRNFTTTDAEAVYTVTEDLGATTSGTFTVRGARSDDSISTVDLDGKAGFELSNNNINFILQDVKVKGNTDLATVSNGNARITLNGVELEGNIVNSAALTTDYRVNITGTTNLNGQIKNADVNLNGGVLTMNTNSLQYADFKVNSGTLDFQDDSMQTYTFRSLDSAAGANYKIDMDIAAETVDGFVVTGDSTGTVTLAGVNILNPETVLSSDYVVRVLYQGEDGDAELALTPDVQIQLDTERLLSDTNRYTYSDVMQATTDWAKIYADYEKYSDIYGKLGLLKSANSDYYDSIGIASTREEDPDLKPWVIYNVWGDTLKLVNQYGEVPERSFETTDSHFDNDGDTTNENRYLLSEDIGETAAGKFTIKGAVSVEDDEISTIDFDGRDGFNLTNETELILNHAKLTNAKDNILIVVTNPDASLTIDSFAIADGSIANAGTMSNAGKITGNVANTGTLVNTGYIDGNFVNGGENAVATTKAEAIGGTIDNTATLYLSGSLNKAVSGDGVTKIDTSLTFADEYASIAGGLDMNDGELIVSAGAITQHALGSLTGDGSLVLDMLFDVNIAEGNTIQTDKLVANNFAGVITITALNTLGNKNVFDAAIIEYAINDAPINNPGEVTTVGYESVVLEGGSSVQLQLSDDVRAQYNQVNHVIDTVDYDDNIEASTTWDHQYKHHNIVTNLEKEITVNENNTAIDYNYNIGKYETLTSMGDTLVLVNRADIDDKYFTTESATAAYYLTENLGETIGFNLTISGKKDDDGNISTLYFGNFTGFDLDNMTTLKFNTVKVVGQEYIVKADNINSRIEINDSIIEGSIESAGTLINNGIITGDLTNSGTATTKAEAVGGIITNTGVLKLTGILSQNIYGNGSTILQDDFVLNNGAGVSGTLNLNSKNLTVSAGEVTEHTFGKVIGDANLSLDVDFLTQENPVVDKLIANVDFNNTHFLITSLNAIGIDLHWTTDEELYALQDLLKDKGFEATILDGARTDVTLELAQSVKDEYDLPERERITDIDFWVKDEADVEHKDKWIDVSSDIKWTDSIYHSHTEDTTTYELSVVNNSILKYLTTNHVEETITKYDTLCFANTTDMAERTFYTKDVYADYKLSKDLGQTSAGDFTIRGANVLEQVSAIDLQGRTGFELSNETTLTLTNVKLYNAKNNNVITINNPNAKLFVGENSKIDGNLIVEQGQATAYAQNIGRIINNAEVNLAGILSTTILGDGVTKVGAYDDHTLTLARSGNITGTLGMNNGTVEFTPGFVAENRIGQILGNGNITIDVDLLARDSDRITVVDDSIGTLTITNINFLNELPKDFDIEDFRVQILDTTTDALQLAIGIEDEREFLIKVLDPYTIVDQADKVTTWYKEYNITDYAGDEVYGKLKLATTNTTNDSLALDYSRTEKHIAHQTRMDSLKLVNQLDETDRVFEDVLDDSADMGEITPGLYTVIENLGQTEKGLFTVKGSEERDSVIDMNNHSGFEVTSDEATELVLDKVTVKNAETYDNGSVICAASANDETKISLVDTNLKDNKSNGFGGAIYSENDLSIKAVTRDVEFSNNVSGSKLNDVYMAGDEVTLTLGASAGKTLALNSGLEKAADTLLTLNINENANDGTVRLNLDNDTNIGTTNDKLVSINFNGGTFDISSDEVSPSIFNTIYTSKIEVNGDTDYKFDVDVAYSKSDKIWTRRYREKQGDGKLILSQDSINVVTPEAERDVNAVRVRLLDIRHATADYIIFRDNEGELTDSIPLYAVGEGAEAVTYYAMLGLNGSILINSNPNNKESDLVNAAQNVDNKSSVTYKLNDNRELYNWGKIYDDEADQSNPSSGTPIRVAQAIQSKKFTIKGNGLTRITTPTEIEGFAISGTPKYAVNKQQLIGQNFTIGGFNSAFINNGGKLKLTNVNLEANETERSGAGIRNVAGSATFQGKKKQYVRAWNNIATDFGGAISNDINGTLTVKYAQFGSEPTESDTFGNDAYIGGAIYNIGKKITIANSYFVDNIADEKAGAVYTGGKSTIKSSTFTSNMSALGGAIYIAANPDKKSAVSLSKDNFYKNEARDVDEIALDGGAIYVEYGKVSISKSNFGSATSDTVDGNIADRGGAIFNKRDEANVNNSNNKTTVKSSNFVQNSAFQGGAIYNEGAMSLSGNNFGLMDKFQVAFGNKAEQGGALYNAGTLTDSKSKYYYNEALYGGAIYNKGNLIAKNSSGSVTGGLKSVKLEQNKADVGGAVYNEGVLGAVKATFTNNKAAENGGALYNDEYVFSPETGQVVKGEVTLKSATFTQNKAGENGGAIYNDGHLLADKSTFGKAPNTKTGITYENEAQNGGAIYNNFAARITNSKFNSNVAKENGGAIYTAEGVSPIEHSAVIIDKSNFTNNVAGENGGAVYVGEYSIAQIADTSFTGNHAGVHGGAIYADKNSEVDIMALKKNVTFKDNTAGEINEAIYLDTATLKLYANKGRKITINDKIYGNDSTLYLSGAGKIYISNEAELRPEGSGIHIIDDGTVLVIGNELSLVYTDLTLQNNATTSIANNRINTLALKTLSIENNTTANIVLDANLKTGETDKVTAQNFEGGGTLNASGINLTSNSKTPVTLNIGEGSLVSSVSAKRAETAEATYKLKTSLDRNGYLMARAYGQRAKATVLAAPVAAQLGGYLTQINSYDQAFMNMDMNMTKTLEERQAEMSTKFAYQAGSDVKLAYSPQFDNGVSTNGKGLWTRPYATFERVNLSNGPKVGNIAYGNFFGGDADLKDMRNGWKRQFSAYIGYNGSVQDFDRQSIDQNGGTIGITEVWYKNNFFTGLTVNVGANAVNASTDIGHENFPMLMAGVASKTGYNFEFKRGRFIIQPSLLLSYSFVHTFSHNNGRGSHVGSSPLNAIQVAPGLKFIANLPKGWQPYIGINMRWNIMDKTHFSLPDVNIPDMSVDPYVEYGIGLQRKWGDRFTGFGQAMIRNGGRNGIMLSFGFKWALGK